MRILFSIVLFFVFSCSVFDKQPEKPQPPAPPAPGKYLPSEKVVDLFTKFDNKQMGMFEEKLNKGASLRLLDVISEEEFFKGVKITKVNSTEKSVKEFELGSSDLREFDTPVVSQWGGTCTAHGIAAGIENALKGKVNLSERHVWSKYKRYSCESAIKAWDGGKACITEAAKWPNGNIRPYSGYLDSKNCYSYLLKTKYINNDIQQMIDNLKKGLPVYIGMSVTKSMLNCDTALNPNSATTGGGHALSVVGHVVSPKVPGGGYFIVKNSWGADCGDKGYQYIPFNYCNIRQDMYCIMWSIVSVK